jgi:hypothetical protein
MTTTIILGLLVGGLVYLAWYTNRYTKYSTAAYEVARQLRKGDVPVECVASRAQGCEIWEINRARQRWSTYVVAVTATDIAIYPVPTPSAPSLIPSPYILPIDCVRWFGRPRKYTIGVNEIWLHAEHNGGWTRLRLRLYQQDMQAFVRILKDALPENLIKAYRRQRPYIHYGPVQARLAEQDMLGAWTLHDPVDVYLTPSHFVILNGASIRQTFPLDSIQKIAAINRLDQPRAGGLVRFNVGETVMAFAIEDHEKFAAQFAVAAKRSLADPVEWQRKKKKDEPEDE